MIHAVLLLLAADIVHLKSGGKLEGNVVDLGDTVRVEMGNGASSTVKREEIREIIKCKFIPDPPRGRVARPWGPRHVDGANFLRIDPPAGWESRAPVGKAVAGFYRDGDPGERFDVLLQRNAGGIDDAVSTFRNALRKKVGEGAVAEESYRIGGRDARALSAGFEIEGKKQRLLWIFVASGDDRILTVAYSGAETSYKSDEHAVRDAAASLAALPDRAISAEDRKRFARLLDEAGGEEPREAVRALNEALAIVEDFAPAHLMLAQAHAALGQGDKAETAFRRARELDPGDLRAATAYGNFLRGKTDFKAAIALLDPLAGENESCVDLYIELAQAFLGAGLAFDARACAGHATALDRTCAEAHYVEGTVHEKLGDKSKALSSYRSAVVQDQGFEKARAALERLGWKP
ncbi:MAG: hypothetical protein A3F84_19995 [Candidatus Handelsmanbacteria bacterium RIFCSPLOWO2_12_FULL_64_10]|uniref:Uncharacterized protein n=1 Tax=Handelsmanbacteria sp. (strain RIFCSPLOWO2_12_FULL_64_10) TaxID=1817868 RepID=A0A1F6C9A2_HANXR|nr:MAG: hypothetical protein A3F84_19995 [Candidatus Handelsmanbacteria bacterium RIFCSPLOWO2_12_FULL_64_10]